MKVDFKEKEENHEIEVGDLVRDRDWDIYIVIFNYNEEHEPYLLVDTDDCQVFKTYHSLGEIAEDFILFKRKWEYKLTDN